MSFKEKAEKLLEHAEDIEMDLSAYYTLVQSPKVAFQRNDERYPMPAIKDEWPPYEFFFQQNNIKNLLFILLKERMKCNKPT